jgi:hypothetical protein
VGERIEIELMDGVIGAKIVDITLHNSELDRDKID